MFMIIRLLFIERAYAYYLYLSGLLSFRFWKQQSGFILLDVLSEWTTWDETLPCVIKLGSRFLSFQSEYETSIFQLCDK